MIYELENKLSSREVAEMIEMEHAKLLRKIDDINLDFRESKIGFSKYWQESTYKVEGQLREYREFQITKRGCEFLAHKTTGTKGNLFTDRYMDKFAAMEDFINNPNGIVAILTKQIENLNTQVQQLSNAMIVSKGRKNKLQISESLEQRLSYITADMVNEILANSLATGLLRITSEGNVVDKDVLFSEANKLGISKHDIKVKLKLLNKIIYKQVRINAQTMWCIIVKR